MNKEKRMTLNLKNISDEVSISDGYHTFDELYEHRIVLFITLCKKIEELSRKKSEPNPIWKSQLHSDGSNFDGWFILGIGAESGKQITYHLPNEYWDKIPFAVGLKKAPTFDGHKPQDVLSRIMEI
jgi:hypothetical protein